MYFWIFFILVFCTLSSCTLSRDSLSVATGSLEESSYTTTLSDDERIAMAKKRRSQITGIRKWDFYSLRNAPEDALAYYMEALEKLPGDPIIRKKVAHVYALMKNWSRSYREYIQVAQSELTEDEFEEMLQVLFFDESTFDRLWELAKLQVQSGSLEYYETIDICYSTIHNCIVHIQSYTGTETRLIDLQNQIQKAEKISPDYQYRNLLVAAKLYEQKMFHAVETILYEVLTERPDYLEVKKILGLALFELGKYEESKKYLLEYLESNPKDLDVIVTLGEVYVFIGDYVSSNLYLNNAIIAWYTPKTSIERRLAYNYSLLDDFVGMMKVMNYLLQEEDAMEDDFVVGISLALEEWSYTRAVSWARAGLEKFPESRSITPLYVEALRLDKQIDLASSLLQNTPPEVFLENPSYLLEKAIIDMELWDIPLARKTFLELIELTDWPDISQEAQMYLTRIETLSGSTTNP